MHLTVNEIFYSIQGESLYSGLPCLFLRLTGCNLRCSYCDTRYAYEDGQVMTISEILYRLSGFSCRRIAVTGGEPLCQETTPALVSRLIANGYTVLLETNGSKDIRMVDPRCVKILDIKCPGSGHSENNDMENLHHLGPKDQVKFVITDRRDFEFAKKIVHTQWPGHATVPILFSAAAPVLNHTTLAGWILEDHLDVRLQVQLHKILWPDECRGR